MSEKSYDKLALLIKRETDYGIDAGPTATANAILAQNVKVKPMAAEMVERKFYRNFWGARPKLRTGKHMTVDFEIEAAGSGTAGIAPAYSPILRMGALAETLVTGLATIAPAAVPGTGTVGRFTFTKQAGFAGLYARTVTITCTIGGASGVAAFTVAAPATPGNAAYSVAGVVMTSGSPFALPGGAVILPTVTTDFTAGDSFTIALSPARAFYTPVSAGVESTTVYANLDGTLHMGLGGRSEIGLKVTKKGFPIWTVQAYWLFVPITAAALPADCDYSGFKDPDESAPETVPAFMIDGHEPALSELTIQMGNKVGMRQVVNRRGIRLSGRDATVSATIDEPDLTEKDYYALVDPGTGQPGPTVPLWLRHGTTAGSIIDVSAPAVQWQELDVADDENVKQLQLKGGLQPVSGNDDVVFSIG